MTNPRDLPSTPDEFNARSHGRLPGLVGMEILEIEPGRALARLDVRPDLLAPNGYLHAATVIALADTCCGYGCTVSFPDGATGFTTVEIKTNFLSTVLEGGIACHAWLVHGGRTTQIWDAEVTAEATGKKIALFRCTQMLLYPR